jgi:hypothetical protein
VSQVQLDAFNIHGHANLIIRYDVTPSALFNKTRGALPVRPA